MKDISVIVPIYNVDNYINKCVNSIVSQTIYEKLEILLIDDGSTDNSGIICDEFAKKFTNINVIHQKNQGVSIARNTGLDNATGKYIAFVDADDYVDADFFEKMLILAEQNQSDIVVFDYFLEFDSGKLLKKRKTTEPKEWDNKNAIIDFLSGENIGVNLFDKLFNKKCIGEKRFNPQIAIGEDLYFIFLCLLDAKKTNAKFEAGYYYLQRDGSAMNSKFTKKYFDVVNVSNDILKIISEKYSELLPYAKALLIHSQYKTLERAYKFKADKQFEKELQMLEKSVKRYKIKEAYSYLSKKQFLGLMLIKFSPEFYLFVCKIMKI